MNIKFEDIFNLTIAEGKRNWENLFVNSVLTMLFSIVIFIVSCIVIAVPVMILFGLAFAINDTFGAVVAVMLPLLVIIALLALTYVSMTNYYVIAKSTLDNTSIFACIKRVYSKQNIMYFLKSVYIRILLSFVILFGVTLLGVVINPGLGIIIYFILLILFVIYLFYIMSFFTISLYYGEEIENSSKLLLQSYTRKDIMKAYFVQFGLSFIYGIALGILTFIPILGIIAQFFLAYVGGGAIAIAMIIKIRGIELSSNAAGSVNPFASKQNITLQNDDTQVVVNLHGGQVQSFVSNGVEYMWQADPQYWGQTAPVLFPFVGRLKDDKYIAGEQTINISQDGFLGDRVFKVEAQTANSVTLVYTSTLADYDLYPCDFTLEVSYQLIGHQLTTTYNIVNNSSYQMPYQIGGYPAFNVDSVNDLSVVFPPQTVTKHNISEGLQVTTEQIEINVVDLSYDLINKNIPCFSDFSQSELLLKNKGQDFIKFDFKSMDYLALWSPEYKNAKLICIQPANGIGSRADQQGYLLENKDGMYNLAPNASQSCSFSFEIC